MAPNSAPSTSAPDIAGKNLVEKSGVEKTGRFPVWPETISFWLLITILAWAPFPLGSNRPWSWALLSLLVVACWVAWVVAVWQEPEVAARQFRRVAMPVILASLALLWGLVQICPSVFTSWAHPIWAIGADGLGIPLHGMIALDPWRTSTELMKLATYVMAAWLAYALCQRSERAERLLDALILIGIFYAIYALVLGMLGLTQIEVLYSSPSIGGLLAGPFVGHAHFATYVGMLALCACVRLFALGSENIATGRGLKPLFLGALKFVHGRGLAPLIALFALISMLIAAASRAGVIAMLVGMIVLLVVSGLTVSRRLLSRWTSVAVIVVALLVVVLFQINGDTLQVRFDSLTEGGEGFGLRTVFWEAASHMIATSPWQGTGLGNFERAYPLFADHVYPFNMDKTHNDYLELVVGWGLPASLAWWGAVLWLAVRCLRGIFQRRRHRTYALVATAATALVAFHAVFDFSLQIPAVALTYAVILGLGVAQAYPSRQMA